MKGEAERQARQFIIAQTADSRQQTADSRQRAIGGDKQRKAETARQAGGQPAEERQPGSSGHLKAD